MGGMPMQMAPMGMDGGMNGPSPGMYGSPGMPIGSGGGDYCPPDGGCDGWTQKYFGFGEFLYLRPTNSDVIPAGNSLFLESCKEGMTGAGTRRDLEGLKAS